MEVGAAKSLHLQTTGCVRFAGGTMGNDEKKCFLLAPIGYEGSEVRRRSDGLLRQVIVPAAADTGYTVVRADDISIPGSITAQIIQLTVESPLVIADLSGRNPNVLYELGIRHAARKPVIQIASDSADLPFDIASVRTIIVDLQNLDSVAHARDQLVEAIRYTEQEPTVVDSPVSAALDIRALQTLQAATERPPTPGVTPDPLMNTIASLVSDLNSRMKGLEYRIERSLRPPDAKKDYSRRVFIIHGHDGEIKTSSPGFSNDWTLIQSFCMNNQTRAEPFSPN